MIKHSAVGNVCRETATNSRQSQARDTGGEQWVARPGETRPASTAPTVRHGYSTCASNRYQQIVTIRTDTYQGCGFGETPWHRQIVKKWKGSCIGRILVSKNLTHRFAPPEAPKRDKSSDDLPSNKRTKFETQHDIHNSNVFCLDLTLQMISKPAYVHNIRSNLFYFL